MKLIALFALAAGCMPAAPPVITAIVNAASYAPSGAPNSAIAQGSIFVIFGTELGPADLQTANGFPLPANLGGTSIRVTVGSSAVDAILLYTWSSQVAAILPSNTPAGVGLLAVSYEGRTSQSAAFRIVRSAPGILAQNQAGNGPALAQNFNSSADQPRNTLTRPARPGQVVTLWGTGLGPITGNDAMAPTPQDMDVSLELTVGGKAAPVRYKGRSGCCAGVDQIVFEVPRDVEGCYVPAVLRTGDFVSNFTTISVASTGGACADLAGASGSDLERLSSGADLNFGTISLSLNRFADDDNAGVLLYNEGGSAQFFRSNRALFSPLPFGLPSLGSCLVTTGSVLQAILTMPVALDAGPVLNLSGPKGVRQLPLRGPGVYSNQFSSNAAQIEYLQAGDYVVDNGTGGRDVGPFKAALKIPPPLNATIQRSANVATVTWTGGDPNGYVMIEGLSSSAVTRTSTTFICTERVSARQFSIPDEVRLSLPQNPGESAFGGSIIVTAPVWAPLRATGLDVGAIYFME
jgi:uncharacterized protein (TIGR03437 family)